MNARMLFTLMLSALLLGAAGQVRAQPYLFAGAGFTKGAGGEHQSAIFTLPGVGYRLSPHLAIEAAYFDAEIEASSTAPLSPTQRIATDRRLDLSAASLAIVGRMPITGGLSLTGEATVYRLRGTVSERDTRYDFGGPLPTATGLGGRSASGAATTYGLGAGLAFDVTQAVELRVRLQWMRGAEGVFGPGRDLETTRIASAGLAFRF